MSHIAASAIAASLLFAGMITLLEAGRRIGRRHRLSNDEGARAGLGAVEGAVFALLGLLIAFTFSGAASRFYARRDLIVREANAIGTACLRLDLLPEAPAREVRELFRRYLDHRLAAYQKLPDLEASRAELRKAAGVQAEIWAKAVAGCQEQPNVLSASILPALNEMFDLATTRTMAAEAHPPAVIFVMLGALALMSALLAGYAMAWGATRSWIHIVGFSLILSLTVYVILDLEYPRLGILRVNSFDRVLIELRQGMQ